MNKDETQGVNIITDTEYLQSRIYSVRKKIISLLKHKLSTCLVYHPIALDPHYKLHYRI
jgi:hypothetical protein